jgi:citrate lyase subunit beta/citryl-CoA lyase
MIAKSFAIDADGIIFDLEDSVSPAEKEDARQAVVKVLAGAKQTDKEVIVRVNVADSYLGIHDILAIVPERPNAIIVPKADERTVVIADAMIGAIEDRMGWEPDTVKLIPLMETAGSIVNAARIIGAARRVDGLQFGAEDLTKDLCIARTTEGDELQYARSVLVFAGRARGIDIIDSPFPDHGNAQGLIAETRRVRALGMTGKTCIHPSQIAPVNQLFTPASDDVAQALRVVEAFDQAVRQGKGACALDGKMIDAPIAERARRVIEKAALIQARSVKP